MIAIIQSLGAERGERFGVQLVRAHLRLTRIGELERRPLDSIIDGPRVITLQLPLANPGIVPGELQ